MADGSNKRRNGRKEIVHKSLKSPVQPPVLRPFAFPIRPVLSFDASIVDSVSGIASSSCYNFLF